MTPVFSAPGANVADATIVPTRERGLESRLHCGLASASSTLAVVRERVAVENSRPRTQVTRAPLRRVAAAVFGAGEGPEHDASAE